MMNNKFKTLIFGVYLSISVTICGYYYINPIKVYAADNGKWMRLFGHNRLLEINFTNFKYSILISIVVGILLFTTLKLINNEKKVSDQ